MISAAEPTKAREGLSNSGIDLEGKEIHYHTHLGLLIPSHPSDPNCMYARNPLMRRDRGGDRGLGGFWGRRGGLRGMVTIRKMDAEPGQGREGQGMWGGCTARGWMGGVSFGGRCKMFLK